MGIIADNLAEVVARSLTPEEVAKITREWSRHHIGPAYVGPKLIAIPREEAGPKAGGGAGA